MTHSLLAIHSVELWQMVQVIVLEKRDFIFLEIMNPKLKNGDFKIGNVFDLQDFIDHAV
jgi:hypothetical protein